MWLPQGQLWVTDNGTVSIVRCKTLIMLQIQPDGHCNGVASEAQSSAEWSLNWELPILGILNHCATLRKTDFQEF